MMTSRSTASPSSASRALVVIVAACAALCLLALARPGVAEAGRKRLVVLEFTGPKADDFRDDVEKLLKKSHSVVPLKKWQSTAKGLNATRVNEKDVKKVARKLAIDGVVTGKVEKRGSRYLVHLTLRDGTTGKTVAAPDLVERKAAISADGRDTIKQELLPAIDDLSSGGDDEDEEVDDEDDDRPSMGSKGRSGFGKGKDAGKAKGKTKGKARGDEDEEADDEDEEEEEARPARGKTKTKGKGKRNDDEDADTGPRFGRGKSRDDDDSGDDDRVAARDDGDDDDGDRGRRRDDDDASVERDVDTIGPNDPRTRAIDLAAGLSFTGRRLSFSTNLQMNAPQGYKGAPVPGLMVAIDAFPLALNRKNTSITRNLGIQVVFDRVIKIESSLVKMGTTYNLPTTEQHLAAGVIYRHLVGAKLEIDASVRFNKRTFEIDRNNPALTAEDVDIPNTDYSYVDPGLALGYVMSDKMMIGGGARFLFVTSTGQMQQTDQYGASTVLGVDVEAGLDYQLASKLLLRVGGRLTTLGFTFKGNGDLTVNRDGDATTQDVAGARDTYFGGFVTGAYVF